MSFEVHREPLYRRYYAPAASLSCCYAIVFGIVLILLPLIIAYNTTIFWTEETIYYEQPDVQYRYQTILQLSGTKSGSNDPVNIFYSTSTAINSLYGQTLRIPLLSSATFDDNKDGKMDRLEINIQMPIASDELIHGFTALVYYNVKFSEKVKYLIDAVSYVNYDSGGGMSALTLDGDLVLRQTWPLEGKGGYKVPYSTTQLIDLTSGSSASDISISNIMRQNTARNLSMVYQHNYQQATGWAGSASTLFNASLTVRIPQQQVRYTPPASAVLAFAWIQYMSFFIVVAFVLYRVNSFIFRNQLLSTYPVADVIYEKMD